MTQVVHHATNLKDKYKNLSDFEALQIATKIADIEAYRQANVVESDGSPSALEAIAICLGMDKQFSVTITNALSDLASAMSNVATAIEDHKD